MQSKPRNTRPESPHSHSSLHLGHIRIFQVFDTYLFFVTMPPKKTTSKGPAPAPAPSEFLGAIPKKQATAAAAAKAAGATRHAQPPKAKTKPEVRGDKRQRNSSGASANTPKKQKEVHEFDPRSQATALGGRHRAPPSPTTSISTIASEATDTGTVEDREVGDELAGIKKCIAEMQMNSVPATQVCTTCLLTTTNSIISDTHFESHIFTWPLAYPTDPNNTMQAFINLLYDTYFFIA